LYRQEEFDHWQAQMKADKISLPSQKELKKKKEAFAEILSRKLTDVRFIPLSMPIFYHRIR
jgi:hypothetical protein